MSRAVTPLRIAIVQSGRRQRDIAAALGMSETHFSRIVNGLHAPDDTRAAIAAEIGQTPDKLWPAEEGTA